MFPSSIHLVFKARFCPTAKTGGSKTHQSLTVSGDRKRLTTYLESLFWYRTTYKVIGLSALTELWVKMNSDTLNSLMAAFDQAPNHELAKVIILELIKPDSAESPARYFKSLDQIIPGKDGEAIAKTGLDIAEFESVQRILDPNDDAHEIIRVRCFLGAGQQDAAKNLYQKLVANDQNYETADLNRRLGVEADSKPKLRVIERPSGEVMSNVLEFKDNKTTFRDVVGLEKIKKQIERKIILPFQKPSLFQKFKKKVGGGVLLYGPPGCGKTLLARATAGECDASFFNIQIADVLDMYIGESENKLHNLFEKARQETPSVMFFDEIEALAGKRTHGRNSSQSNVVSQFLTELDGFSQENEGVLVLGSTNVPWSLDAAFLRPGRFDRMFFVPPPDKSAREGILKHHLIDRPSSKDVDFALIASRTAGYSGADLANIIEMAADEAIDETLSTGEETAIRMEHFSEVLNEAKSSTVEWLSTARNYAKYANDGGRYDDVLDFIKKNGRK